MVATLGELTEDALVQILTEPKNALVKQYQKLFAMDGVELDNPPHGARRPLPARRWQRKTGARGLRSIMEQSLIDTMFELPPSTASRRSCWTSTTSKKTRSRCWSIREQAKASA